MSEFKSDVGTIYTAAPGHKNDRWECWFEDFNIIGQGSTELDALIDAGRMTAEMNALCLSAVAQLQAKEGSK